MEEGGRRRGEQDTWATGCRGPQGALSCGRAGGFLAFWAPLCSESQVFLLFRRSEGGVADLQVQQP
jgi:hypothetical protein